MGTLRRLQPVAAALLLAFLLNACAATQRTILWRRKATNGASASLKSASLDDLNTIISHTSDGVHSFAATVTLAASSGSVYQGWILDYPDLPFVRALAFDMVSNGSMFRLNRENKEFITGLNSAPAHSRNKIDNLRPQAFLSSMLIQPWDQKTESVMLKDDTDEENALYRLEFNRRSGSGGTAAGRGLVRSPGPHHRPPEDLLSLEDLQRRAAEWMNTEWRSRSSGWT